MRFVHGGQMFDVGWRVPADELVPAIAALFHHPAFVIPPDQPCQALLSLAGAGRAVIL
jgi:hypothetical protein